jgi:hypothetical protein
VNGARWHGQNKNWSSARDQMPCKPCVMIRAEHGLGSVRDSHRRVMIRFDPIVYWPCISTIRAASQLRVHARSQGNATRSVAKLVITRRVVVCRRASTGRARPSRGGIRYGILSPGWSAPHTDARPAALEPARCRVASCISFPDRPLLASTTRNGRGRMDRLSRNAVRGGVVQPSYRNSNIGP